MKSTNIKVGFISAGLNTYWGQFDGLLDHLRAYAGEIISHMESLPGVEVRNAGMVDSPEMAAEKAGELKRAGIELLFVHVATYCLSSTILPVAQEAGCPVILLNVQPTPAIDYARINALGDRGKMTGMWLESCNACSIPEIAGVFNNAGIPYDIVTGHLRDDSVWKEIAEWLKVAQTRRGLRNTRLGLMGHYYCGMVDVYTDLRRISTTFGSHIDLVEMDELASLRSQVTPAEVAAKEAEFADKFEVSTACTEDELERAAKTSVALDKLVEAHRLGAMAYYYEGVSGNEHENIVTSVIAGNTLLTGKGIPVAGEYEVKNAMAMKIMSLLGAGGSFSEFYAMDFDDDVVLFGHDGPAHYLMADGKVGLVPLPVYHGKPGKGLSIQMTVRESDVTLLSVCEGRDGIFLLAAEGRTVPGSVLEIGNTNSRYSFPCGMRSFVDQWCKAGPSHHCAIGIGHLAGELQKLAFLLGIDIKIVK
ncbi:MAG: L-fucose/L-arabinose isomerase family protein [Bacteroidales bacterium]|nr:L-fucose/L-arabinose isomerase family protein [Bacteroidales bacterium]